MDGLTEGRTVHYVLPNGEHRAAIVAKVWNKETGYVNLQVITDGPNDLSNFPLGNYDEAFRNQVRNGLIWRTSIYPDETNKAVNSWHWVEKA